MADLMDALIAYGNKPQGIGAAALGATQGLTLGMDIRGKREERELAKKKQRAEEAAAEQAAVRQGIKDALEADLTEAKIEDLKNPKYKPEVLYDTGGAFVVDPMTATARKVEGVPGKSDRPLTEVKTEFVMKQNEGQKYDKRKEIDTRLMSASKILPQLQDMDRLLKDPSLPTTGEAAPLRSFISSFMHSLGLQDATQMLKQLGLPLYTEQEMQKIETLRAISTEINLRSLAQYELSPTSDTDVAQAALVHGGITNTKEALSDIISIRTSNARAAQVANSVVRKSYTNEDYLDKSFRADEIFQTAPKVVAVEAGGTKSLFTFEDMLEVVSKEKQDIDGDGKLDRTLNPNDADDALWLLERWESFTRAALK